MTRRVRANILDAFLEESLRDEGPRVDFEVLLAAEPAKPSASLKDRLFASLRATNRFDDLEARVAELADVTIERARELLLAVDTNEVWERASDDGIDLFHFTGGPKVQNAVTGFVRVAPGAVFPHHEHVGEERVLVMAGALVDSSGTRWEAGELIENPAGSAHAFQSVGPATLLIMSIIHDGLIVGGELIPPGDPRA